MKIFDTRIFLEPERVSLRSFLELRDKKFATQNRDIPSFPQNVEISGGINVFRKHLKTRFKKVVSFSTVCRSLSKQCN